MDFKKIPEDSVGNGTGIQGLTATVTELNYTDGVIGPIQDQIDAKATKLTENTTVNIPFGTTAANIQLLINAQPSYTAGYMLTFQLADCPYKYFNAGTDNISGDGTTTTVTLAGHGFTNGDVVAIDAVTTVNGVFTITVTDENIFTFLNSYNGSHTPTASGIARKVWTLNNTLDFSKFVGNVILKGNMSETNATASHSNQRVFLYNTGGTKVLYVGNSPALSFYVYNVNIHSTITSIELILAEYIAILKAYYCSFSTNQVSNGQAIHTRLSQSAIVINKYQNLGYAIHADESSIMMAYANTTVDGVLYGINSEGSMVLSGGTQPTGSTANQLKSLGGQIYT